MKSLIIMAIALFAGAASAAEPTYYAQIDANGLVLRVIVADAAFIAKMPGRWVQTTTDGTIRKNYAAPGLSYDQSLEAFVTPKPYPSWTLNPATAQFAPPVALPKDGANYRWDESTRAWVKLPPIK